MVQLSMTTMTENNESLRWLKIVTWGCGIFAGLLLLLFAINQHYDCSQPFDTGIFGTYGDVLSGVVGSIIGFYSAYLLIKTLQNQANVNKSVADTNKDIVETNKTIVEVNKSTVDANRNAEAASQRQYYQTELQLFDNKFRSYLDVYQKAIESYIFEPEFGKSALAILAQQFVNVPFDNNNDYKRRSQSATDEYLMFYSNHRTMMSVHLRMLYLLVSMISESNLEEEDKVLYAKLVRGQMTDAEMLIVRYNCMSYLGKKMQPYCNQYNLTKHLPIMSLLEFQKYRKEIEQNHKEDDSEDKLISALDAMFITLRKIATKMFYDDGQLSESYETSHSYEVILATNMERTEFVTEIKRDKEAHRRGGGIRISPEEKALDCLDDGVMANMFKDFLSELFINSNFQLYNNNASVVFVGKPIEKKEEYKCKLRVSDAGHRLALSYIQMQNRDYKEVNIEQ